MTTLIENLEPELCEITIDLKKSTSDLVHIKKATRQLLNDVLKKWSDIIVEMGNMPRENNPMFLRNSQVNPEFAKVLRGIDTDCFFPLCESDNFIVVGAISKGEFYEKMSKTEFLEVKNLCGYCQSARKDENFKFGDPFSWNFCEVVDNIFPVSLYGDFVHSQCITLVAR